MYINTSKSDENIIPELNTSKPVPVCEYMCKGGYRLIQQTDGGLCKMKI